MRHLRRWGAVYLLLLLFVGSWLGQFFTQMAEFTSTRQQHGQPFQWGEFVHQILRQHFRELAERVVDDIKDRLGLPTPPPS